MARWRQAVGLAMTDEDIEKLAAIAPSRSEVARRVERARILLAYREKAPILRCRAKTRFASSDSTALRRTGAGLWPAGGTR
jgi:hypothetical protein